MSEFAGLVVTTNAGEVAEALHQASEAIAATLRVRHLTIIAKIAHPLAELAHLEAEEMDEAGDMLSPLAAASATLLSLASACLLTRTQAPAAMLAAIMARLGVRHRDMPEEEAGEMLAAMLADPKRRELLLDCATEAIDDWLAPAANAAAADAGAS